MKLHVLTGCALAATTVVALGAAPSLAESRSLEDSTGDVWTYDDEAGEPVLAGERVNADLVSTVIKHGASRVSATGTYVDLESDTDTIELAVLLKTDDAKKYWATVFAGPGRRNGKVTLAHGGSSKPVRCADKSKAIDYDANTISMSFPRSCLGKPSWVKHQSAGIVYEDLENPFQGYFIDDSASDQAEPSTWSAKLHRD